MKHYSKLLPINAREIASSSFRSSSLSFCVHTDGDFGALLVTFIGLMFGVVFSAKGLFLYNTVKSG